MKQILTIMLVFMAMMANAQKIRFEYDTAGNQILRTYCISCQSKNSTQPTKEISDLEDSDLQKFFPEDVISYYPNPVKNDLFLKWELIDDNKVNSIEVYSLNGQLIKSFADKKAENTQTISFQEYPIGVYLVHLNYTNGEQKTIKIIKN